MSKLPPPPKSRTPKGLHPVKQAQLARELGVSRQLIQVHRKKSPDAPKDLNIEAWKKFLATKGRIETAPEDLHRQIAREKLAKLKLEKEKLSDALRVSRGELIEFEAVDSFLAQIVGVDYSAELDRMSQELPPVLVGLTAAQMFIEFKREKEKIKNNLKEKAAQWVASYRAKGKKI